MAKSGSEEYRKCVRKAMDGPPVAYGSYLGLSKLLDAQTPLSVANGHPAHEELMFIIVHQNFELWFKLILHEIDSVRDLMAGVVAENSLGTIVERLSRVTEIQRVMNDQFRVLETMTPHQFSSFRDWINPASGFQSLQFRLLEIRLGLTSSRRLTYNGQPYYMSLPEPDRAQALQAEAEASLFTEVESWLERMPFIDGDFKFWEVYQKAFSDMIEQDRKLVAEANYSDERRAVELEKLRRQAEALDVLKDPELYEKDVLGGNRRLSLAATKAALFIVVYQQEPAMHLPFMLLSVLQEIDELLSSWRYRHAIMVHRMLGSKMGTGGSSGHSYLRATSDRCRIFFDFFNLSGFLIPLVCLPPLPDDVKSQLDFSFSSAHH